MGVLLKKLLLYSAVLVGLSISTHAGARDLTFKERVRAQKAIEQVYWSHRIWPKANLGAKPPLSEVVSDAAIQGKVEDYLEKSNALVTLWKRPITTGELQAELDRIARSSRAPEVLRELYDALGNDPFVIAECLARPLLAERLSRGLFGGDAADFDGWWQAMRDTVSNRMDAPSAPVALTAPPRSVAVLCDTDTWTATSTTGQVPGKRFWHSMIWTGTEMIIWGGVNDAGTELASGGSYTPATDSWATLATSGAPSGRSNHTAVWTGTEMIVWGGDDGTTRVNSGARYNPTSATWTGLTSIVGAPTRRSGHTAVWSGTQMIVWGGADVSRLNTGGKYTPGGAGGSWTSMSTGGMTARLRHTAVWDDADNLMIVWGGDNSSNNGLSSGGRYAPAADSWSPTNLSGAPTPRTSHTAVWTGAEMIVWGGSPDIFLSSSENTGGRYDPATDLWGQPTQMTDAPSGRHSHTAVFRSCEMIVWGGYAATVTNTGGRYNIHADRWTPTPQVGAPGPHLGHTVVWADGEMIVWGGTDTIGASTNTGGRLCLASPTYCTDGDGDGHGNPTLALQTCDGLPPADLGYTTICDDCDDGNDTIYPGADDSNCNAIDENCSGEADEGFPISSTGCGIGPCFAFGELICVNGLIVDTCQPGTPSPEVCDGIDNDCNGIVDDGDMDGDGLSGAADNCPCVFNPDQADSDGDNVGDACECCLTWSQVSSTGPVGRATHGMAYDSVRRVVVLFGGYNGTNQGDTWEWNGTWSHRANSPPPSPRAQIALAYDSVRNRTVMYGGATGGSVLSDTWEWNGATATWSSPPVAGPGPRYFYAMAYDSARHVTVLFGGYTSVTGSPQNDTWEWTGSAWSRVATTGPTPRANLAMAYDSARNKLVLFGGNDGSVRGDTWEWDVANAEWVEVATTGPPAREGHAMAYNSDCGKVILYGGRVAVNNHLGDTWEWDGTTWTQMLGPGPSARYAPAMAYDSARDRVVVFGGNPLTPLRETWELKPCPGTGGAGTVPTLFAAKQGNGDLLLTWTPSCEPSDTDYEVYEGTVFYDHQHRFCTTGGLTTKPITPSPGNFHYYVVVPRNVSHEGSYGIGVPQAIPPCAPQDIICP